ncbi:hypothetical protein EJ06DRAFT_35089 [Trichodelitschia bisporula]|uniref:Uncharacterized protein n=1 Tax=Trichodelitschia bisporula TaxID=703511 RepID=A0A6G1HUW4_9PEZI|nr:hypothetical protein EJ06DRAFT_35089 [Trichodelitschia bisporula]
MQPLQQRRVGSDYRCPGLRTESYASGWRREAGVEIKTLATAPGYSSWTLHRDEIIGSCAGMEDEVAVVHEVAHPGPDMLLQKPPPDSGVHQSWRFSERPID